MILTVFKILLAIAPFFVNGAEPPRVEKERCVEVCTAGHCYQLCGAIEVKEIE
jgi:enoyl reductase-like protein